MNMEKNLEEKNESIQAEPNNADVNIEIEIIQDEELTVESGKELNANKGPNNRIELILKENLSCEMYHFILNIIYSPHSILKMSLSLFTLLGFGLASYMTITLIFKYAEYNVITKIRIINENPVVFPKVTICNTNALATQYAFDFLLKSNLINMTQLKEVLKGERNEAIVYFTLFRASLSAKILNFSNELKKSLGHNLNDTLLSCIFNFELCNSNDFQWEWNNQYGNCFSFNSGLNAAYRKRESFLAGSTFGLRMEFYVNFNENLFDLNSILNEYGLVIRIDNVSHVIDYLDDGIFISPGTNAFISLDRQFKTTLPKPYSNCDDLSMENFNSPLYTLITESKYEYTQKFCLEQCLQELFVRVCNCSTSEIDSLNRANYCSLEYQQKCIYQTYDSIYLNDDYVKKVCLPQCPLECNSSKIVYTLSSSSLSPSIYKSLLVRNGNLKADFINRSLDDERVILQSVVKLNIFYDSLSYTSTDESPQMDVVSLLGSIGGNLGLFMGVCLFSLGEILVAFIEIILFKISTK